MTFIDWSDAEEMLDLLMEFVRDANNECGDDIARRRFLSQLLVDLKDVTAELPNVPRDRFIQSLQAVYDSIDEEFKQDPVTGHIADCIVELRERG
jgi:hypothetical protein